MQSQQQTLLSGFAQFLVNKAYLSERKILCVQKEAQLTNQTLVGYLGKNNIINYHKIAEAIADYFDLPLFDLQRYDIKSFPRNLLTPDLIQKHLVLPIYQQRQEILVAIADPTSPNLSEINFFIGVTPIWVIVEADKLIALLDTLFPTMIQIDADSSPIIKYLDKIIFDAINKKSSDIHFEPYENTIRIRYRIDGLLYEIDHKPNKFANNIIARLKIMANLDISERRVPQDGRFKMFITKNRSIDFRLNTCPTLFGEKAVVRILEASNELLELKNLGMDQMQMEHFKTALHHTQGMILVTGPTGSGKTITLYTALDMLNTNAVNISSVEDPIEIQLPGINQVQINPKAGLTFATVLKAFLRQDPDIIMVGEIRDLETAEIAIKAAQTGHLLLSTLHTNNAPETLTRLANMGAPAFNMASSIILILAQRLLRCLCNHCKQPANIAKSTLLAEGFQLAEIKDGIIYDPVGCSLCHHGYQSRIGIFEVMPISKAMTQLILQKANDVELADLARKEGILNLRLAGLEKVRNGITSLSELNRVIKH